MKTTEQGALPRRGFLKTTLTLGGTALLAPQLAVAQVVESQNSFDIAAGPYLQTNFDNSMAILWLTNKPAAGWVEYGETPDSLSFKAYGKSEFGLRPANSKLNLVELKNLKPGRTYYYKIVVKEILNFQPYKLTYGDTIRTEVNHFINADVKKDEVRFMMMNDIHDRPQSIPQLLALDKEMNNDFVFFNGDIFDYQTDEQQIIDHMLKPCIDTFAKTTPFIYVRGNHETRGKFAREFPQYFQNVGYTAFTLGPVRFIILDTGEDKEDTHPVYADIVDFDDYRIQQASLLQQEIESKAFKKATFKIVMMHIPPRYSGDAHGPKHCTEVFEPLLNKGKVDLVLSGHTHQYKVHLPEKGLNNYLLFIGGGPRDGTRTLTKVVVNGRELLVKMIKDDGTEVGSYSIRK
ncbi:FN3 domain-containing metallophosphoesterase family protein [Pedobacter sp. ASV28]|uniref:FN3 domain-containing metallophosphoesterase family protein n=1 Tax=Pedobacter sp. ASV28 TaxID=2795123 RepID=UPI0018ED6CAF|nr:FN3 domain-containing metallophosphoesterase family protein [Pedobacter sp. ASV28]